VILNEDVQDLTFLGLSVRQAKCYLALAHAGRSSIKTISKTSQIARQDIYRVVSDLEELGLVEKILTAPVEYEAIGIDNCVAVLLQRTTKENLTLQKCAKKLVTKLMKYDAKTWQGKERRIVFIPSAEFIPELRKATEALQKSWDSFFSAEDFKLFTSMGKVFKKAVERNVKFRHIIYEPEESATLLRIDRSLTKTSCWEIRYVRTPNPLSMAILDEDEVILSVDPGRLEKTAWLRTTSPCIIEMAQTYFNLLWKPSENEAVLAVCSR
jgi:sugar-specific transcriptional regulator TrmB